MQKRKAAVFILLGQSNATGHDVPMEEKDIIRTPLCNVFGLHRDDNQSFGVTSLKWSGYTSGGMNLGETQDDTYSVANCLAALWQAHVDCGNEAELGDLYIVHMSVGAEGVGPGQMWSPDKEQTLTPGELGTVNISLFPLSMHIFSLLDQSFSELGLEYEIIGLHWRGGEQEFLQTVDYLRPILSSIYHKLMDEWNRVLHCPPTVLHRIVCRDRVLLNDPNGGQLESMNHINAVFEELERDYGNISIFDVRNAPQYVPDVQGNGIFKGDVVHFTPEVNRWVAGEILNDYINNRAQ